MYTYLYIIYINLIIFIRIKMILSDLTRDFVNALCNNIIINNSLQYVADDIVKQPNSGFQNANWLGFAYIIIICRYYLHIGGKGVWVGMQRGWINIYNNNIRIYDFILRNHWRTMFLLCIYSSGKIQMTQCDCIIIVRQRDNKGPVVDRDARFFGRERLFFVRSDHGYIRVISLSGITATHGGTVEFPEY